MKKWLEYFDAFWDDRLARLKRVPETQAAVEMPKQASRAEEEEAGLRG